MSRQSALVLEDGAVFVGRHFGAEVEAEAEVVFNTSMTGYLEICTDPSYRGQMVTMCHPQIGNYGVAASHRESTRPWLSALIVRDLAERPNHWEASGDLSSYLAEAGVPGLEGVDTRALVRRLRVRGALRGLIRLAGPSGFDGPTLERLRQEAGTVQSLSDQVVVGEVSGAGGAAASAGADRPRIVVLDYGLKHNIVRSVERRGFAATVLPWTASAAEVLALEPTGVVLSNGPGDPATLPDAVRTAGRLIESGKPLFGICLGHQIIGRALGATTSRLPFGHHGGNHPVQDLRSGRVTMTTQNHEFQVDDGAALAAAGFRVSHRNLNDGSIEGLASDERPVFSVQYHPEGCPGPQENQELFDRFVALLPAEVEAP